MAGQQPTATTAQGTVTGKLILHGSQKAFLGLPYATPPTGELRWRPPQPPAAWKGVREATQFGGRCEQYHVWNDYIFLDPGPTEDCLYLNVYVPASSKGTGKLPVMVWIHGGGFIAGAGSEPRYTNSALVSKGVVLVTMNYRLGVFGFLASDGLAKEAGGHAGNYGLMDMAAALRWVKANIAAFGGDPGNVTIFGESAGSFAVNALTAAPEAHGLFQKFIGESGAFFGATIPMNSLAEREHRDQAWIESLGAKNIEELRKLPAEKVLEGQKKAGAGFFPVVDGRFLTESVPETYAAGRQMHVPGMIGWNRDERAGTLSKDMTAAKWKTYAAEHYGDHAKEFLAAFPADNDDQAVRSADDLTTAGFIALGAWKWAEADAKDGRAPVYRYRFDRPAPPEENHPQGKYAFHSDELEFVFGTLDVRRGAVWQPEDRKLSGEMIAYWTNFARTGDPNGEGLPHWARYDKDGVVLHFNEPITAGPDSSRPEFEFLVNGPQPH
ncbi:MAG TPA: carboxylesterase family protein [Acidobacteriaceae bacterium]|jgi:para-nitrobenzyl esterase